MWSSSLSHERVPYVSELDSILTNVAYFLWQLNLLVATKVGEEGLDIQTCCLVIRFDLPQTVASFIQSRGRARMPQSEYVFLVDRCFDKHMLMDQLIQHFFFSNVESMFSFILQWQPERGRVDREF